ncbi:MAG: hypothetical protein ACR2JY_22655 [Chloroflexota bacterium]
MIRQIRRLSRTIVVDDQPMRVMAVYMKRSGDTWAFDDADDTGYEGVACVDDVARVAGLFLEAGRRQDRPDATAEALGYLRFLLYMQQPDGRFVNFILNWRGDKNLTGPTSLASGANWNARALRTLAVASTVCGEGVYRQAFDRAFDPVTREMHYADLRALHVLAALEVFERTREAHLRRNILAWCDQIAGLCDNHGLLLNWRHEESPHLWGYIQAGVLARASAAFGRNDWLRLAEETVLGYLAPRVRAGFPQRTVIPYEVSSVIVNLDVLTAVTGDNRYRELLYLARAWFRGRNAAAAPVYDVRNGFVADGIDGEQLSPNSGAESNVEGALALVDELPWALYYSDADWRSELGRER